MKYLITTLTALLVLIASPNAFAQKDGPPAAKSGPVARGAGHMILKHDVGTWKGNCVLFMPGGTEESAPVTEVNRMVGNFWVVSDFTMQAQGYVFYGHSTVGYDDDTSKYSGSWVDSTNPNIMHMVGTWDQSNRTMTMDAKGLDAAGIEVVSRITTTYSEDGNTRIFTKSDILPGSDDYVKTMEITYTRAPEGESADDDR